MPRLKTDIAHDSIREDIKVTARRLMITDGAGGLSLRAIARELDVTAPALYRYYPSLDDLITALVLDGFNGLADAMQAAFEAAPAPDIRARFVATLHAYHQWAVTHPIEYLLIYGTPIPGYEAPREVTVPAAARIFYLLAQPIQFALEASKLVISPTYAVMPSAQAKVVQELIEQSGYPTTPEVVYLSFICFTRLYGLVMPAILGHLVPLEIEAFIAHEIDLLCQHIGFKTD